MRGMLSILAILALGACQPRPAHPLFAPPVLPGPAKLERGLAGDFNLRGTEPFWAVDIRRDGLTYQRPDHPALTAANPGMTEAGGKAVWSTTAGGQLMKVTLSDDGDCSDGMSDLVYRYSAVVMIGAETLHGCAYKPTEPPQGRR